ncbi:catechol 1,2-dioxygenase [Sphingopyxis sp.]|uniref:catechol 1,2-dioxygenase n=1 Tax=Sphingopyxis sp. TaxID=1908224 RepID=UPI0025FCDD5D|nr:catechol 1,2-dioxygenase [Sphingopyxis sp.]MBK6411674.1 catechol 1,2-dioxygenase [Sphingopyxis sp.]
MSEDLVQSAEVQQLLDRASGVDAEAGDPRLKQIMRRMLADLFATIDAFDISEDEFWHALHFAQQAAPEFGLIVPGIGLERFLDIRADRKAAAAGLEGGTPRTIEGPLYVAGAPRSVGEARLDDGTEKGEVLIMHGRVLDISGKPLAGALVEVWHANTAGGYSHFDPSQPAYNLRRQIETDSEGRYKFRSIIPSGYSVPPGGSSDNLLTKLGRHGHRPAHIHFFVSANKCLHLTTQINIDGDPYLHDDFAFATRDDLIPAVVRREETEAIVANNLNEPFSEIEFDFILHPAASDADTLASTRPRAG